YWIRCEPESAELRAAHRELRSPTGEASHRRAFGAMLHSGQAVAVGIALDHFHHRRGLTRFGLDARAYAPQVLAVARDVLKQPPLPKSPPRTRVGRNHASALDVLAELAGPEDAEAIAVGLRARGELTLVRKRALR